MKNPVIAVDLDDVLASSAQGFVDYSNKRWGTRLTVEDYTEHWHEMWSTDHAETVRCARDVYSSGTIGEFIHFDEALPVLKELSKRYDLVITTSRNRVALEETEGWIKNHFEDIFSDVHFAGIWDDWARKQRTLEQAAKLTKAELPKGIGATYLIDDPPKHWFGAAKVGVKCLLYGDYSWNRNLKLPDGVTRVKDWDAILMYFDEQA